MDGINFNSEVEAGVGTPQLKPKDKPQVAFLIDVKFDKEYETGEGEKKKTQPVLVYTFSDSASKENPDRRESSFIEFDPEGAKDKQAAFDRTKKRWLNIYETFWGKKPDEKFFAKCKSTADAMKAMADGLNTGAGADKKSPVYLNSEGVPRRVWLICVYYKNFVNLPLDKFIEIVREGKEPKIEVNPNFHTITREVKAKATATPGASPDAEFDVNDLPM